MRVRIEEKSNTGMWKPKSAMPDPTGSDTSSASKHKKYDSTHSYIVAHIFTIESIVLRSHIFGMLIQLISPQLDLSTAMTRAKP